ncbi:MAG: efflux RND transporter permease subunit [Calditrichaeota bacterium]|nr:efflux RND transporter permease subunit [Calditrichota bacterium]MCB9367116.1 efflux RND transporter permease subunit [Calditrichota bacterium]MCB9391888.1 efflux RND transporter permease subunit [Calditrichota bacterium]
MTVTELSIKRPTAVVMFFLAIAVLGIMFYPRLPVDLLPTMNWPYVTIVTVWPGAGPQEVETMVTRPIEDAVVSLNKLKHIRSINRENASVVALEFEMSADADVVLQEAQRVITTIRAKLPDDVDEPQILKADLGSIPILRVAVSSEMAPSDLFTFVDEVIRPRLEQVEGVGQVVITGAEEREIQIAVDPGQLKSHGLSLADFNQYLAADNLDVPAGKVYSESQDYAIRLSGKYSTLAEIERTRLPLPDGTAIYLRDVATVTDTIKSERSLTRLDRASALGVQVVKQAQANSVQTSSSVQKVLNDIEAEHGTRVQIEVAQDVTVFNRNAIAEVQRNIAEALITVALVLLVFLHSMRNSLIVLIAIPLSVVSTFISMKLFNFSINLMTMMALGTVIGVLVDDSIVVLENIHQWMKRGHDPVTSAIRGRNEIGLAALSITAVDVVTFLPIAFVEGLVGNIFREFSVVFVTALVMSLIVSFTVTPLLASRLNRLENVDSDKWLRGFTRAFERMFGKLESGYKSLLGWALSHRLVVIGISTAAMVFAIALIPMGFIGSDFVPPMDRGEFAVATKMPLGTTLEENSAVMGRIENYLDSRDDVIQIMSTIGLLESEWGLEENPRLGNIQIKLISRDERKLSTAEVQNQIVTYCKDIPGLEIRISDIGMFGTANAAPIQYEIRGQNLDSVQIAADYVKDVLRTVPGARDVQTSYELGAPELKIVVDRDRAAASMLTPGQVAATLRSSINGDLQTEFRTGEIEVDVRTLLATEYRTNPTRISDIEIRNGAGQMVPLGEVAEISRTSGPSSITRKDRQRLVTVSANVVGRSLGEVQGDFDKLMEAYTPPQGVQFFAYGDVENMRTMVSDMIRAIFLSILFIYMVLVVLYESYIYPFVVMFSVPVAIVGAFVGLAVTGYTLSMFSMIGLLILMGLVTKNGILIVDFTNQLRHEGHSMKEALLEAGPRRLRPIVMTTLTMVVGMMPLALALGDGSEMRAGMGVVIIGGLLSSLLLSLVIVPVMYTILDRFSRKAWGVDVLSGTDVEAIPVAG